MTYQKIITIWLTFISLTTFGQEINFNYRCQIAYQKVTELRFTEARTLLRQEHLENPKNLAVDYIADYLDFLRVFINEEQKDFESSLEARKLRIERIESASDFNPAKNYLLGDIYLRWAMLRGKFDQKFRPVVELNKAYWLLKKNYENHPKYIPTQADLGVIEVLIGSIPDSFHWIAGLLNLEGSVESGIAKITQALHYANQHPEAAFLEIPALFMISFIEMNLGETDNPLMHNRFHELDSTGVVEQNPLLRFLYADLLQKNRNNEKALEVLSDYTLQKGQYPFYFLYYMKGLSELYAMNPACIQSFQVYLDNFKGRHYLKSAIQKQAWFYLLSGDSLAYHTYSNRINEVGEEFVGADQQAQDEYKENKTPDVSLLRARLQFDGGYYDKSLKTLTQTDRKNYNPTQVTEYYYRRGRIFHESALFDSALVNYQKSYQTGKDLPQYYAANAKLMMGRIYLKLGKKTLALQAFDACLNLDGFQYEYAIHQKAKAGKNQSTKK
jgi:tetratricopeptide (TPR) repeat protein